MAPSPLTCFLGFLFLRRTDDLLYMPGFPREIMLRQLSTCPVGGNSMTGQQQGIFEILRKAGI